MAATRIAVVLVTLGAAGSSFAQQPGPVQPGPVQPVQPAPGPLEPPKFQPAPIPEAVAESVKKSVKEADPFDTETSLGAAPAAAPAKPPTPTAKAAPATGASASAAPATAAPATAAPATGSTMPSLAAPAPAPRTTSAAGPQPTTTPTPPPTIQQTTVPDATPGLTPTTPTPVPPPTPAPPPPARSELAPRALPPAPSQYEDLQPQSEPAVSRQALPLEPRSPFGAGLGLQVGGGLMTYSSSRMAELTGAGGYWDARVVMGLGKVFSFELAYVGSATPIAAPGVADGASLVGNGIEGALRLNVPLVSRDGAYALPYGVVGMGWQRYRITNGDTNGTVVAAQDDVSTIPVGGGLTIGYRHLYLDTRFIYRTSQYEDLLTGSSNTRGQLRQWSLGGHVGYVF